MAAIVSGEPRTWPGAILAGVFLVIAGLVFAAIYLLVPSHAFALFGIGILALLLGVVCYLAQAVSRDPVVQRSLGWGFGAMGYAALFLTVLSSSPSLGAALLGLALLLMLLPGTLAFAFWRAPSPAATERRSARRNDWAS